MEDEEKHVDEDVEYQPDQDILDENEVCTFNSEKKGYPARRDEVWIATHLRRNGEPIPEAASTVKELKEVAENHPELKQTILEGDLFASVCGEKEPRDVDKKGLATIADEVKQLAQRARDNSPKPEDYEKFVVSTVENRVAPGADGQFDVGSFMSATLSCDHRPRKSKFSDVLR
ncbi:hypothetical protein E2562_013200 [Oryza meyeriana var. granulata]|uniref:Uncharacterized protein n=1 Tax=Oryza meyeriana var. granulata TaxID=110450 RepID=A0A6G1DI22_9ORYZ|nr:hypothetical protein E2562_013200 [Oryza meyeriana var. granulata]